jgi:hypothetical protein
MYSVYRYGKQVIAVMGKYKVFRRRKLCYHAGMDGMGSFLFFYFRLIVNIKADGCCMWHLILSCCDKEFFIYFFLVEFFEATDNGIIGGGGACIHYEKVSSLYKSGVGWKRLEFIIPFYRIYIQSFPVEIRPNKQFVHSRIDEILCRAGRIERRYNKFRLFPTAENVGNRHASG